MALRVRPDLILKGLNREKNYGEIRKSGKVGLFEGEENFW